MILFENLLQDSDGRWALLQSLSASKDDTYFYAEGAAAAHAPWARLGAARKIIEGRMRLLTDITSPSPVSQLELRRLPREDAYYVDQVL